MFSSNPTESVPLTGTYTIDVRMITHISSLFFISNEQERQLCIKMWRPLIDNGWKPPEPLSDLAEYLVDGLHFSRRWAPGIYLGVVSVQLLNDKGMHDESVNDKNAVSVHLETWLPYPQGSDLCDGKEYALVMERLDPNLFLDYQLTQHLDSEEGMKFLAQRFCDMHRSLSMEIEDHQLEESREKGGLEALAWKLQVNQQLFKEGLEKLDLSPSKRKRYNSIIEFMSQAFERCEKLFTKRSEARKIMRCHGDLKVANLWLRPDPAHPHELLSRDTQLLALDCIDFEPKLCYIDTLSDIAMLAVDINERFLEQKVESEKSKKLIEIFLETYFDGAQEQYAALEPLFEYYLIEKAMVGTFMNAIYDEEQEPERATIYLEIAAFHAKKLHSLFSQM